MRGSQACGKESVIHDSEPGISATFLARLAARVCGVRWGWCSFVPGDVGASSAPGAVDHLFRHLDATLGEHPGSGEVDASAPVVAGRPHDACSRGFVYLRVPFAALKDGVAVGRGALCVIAAAPHQFGDEARAELASLAGLAGDTFACRAASLPRDPASLERRDDDSAAYAEHPELSRSIANAGNWGLDPASGSLARSPGVYRIFDMADARGRAAAHARHAALAQHQFRILFESAPGLYLVLTPDEFRIVAASNAYLEATMTSRERILGKRVFDVFPDDPDDDDATGVSALSASLHRLVAAGRADVMPVQRYPVRRRAEDGGGFCLKYWSPVNSPVLNPDGSVAFIIHRVEDVTDYVLAHGGATGTASGAIIRQEAELVLRSHELKRLAESLRVSEERFRYVVRATKDVVWDWNIRSGALWWSDAIETRLGMRVTPELATFEGWAARIHPAERDEVVASIGAAVAARAEDWSAQYRLLTDDGSHAHVLHRGFLGRDGAGEPARMVGSIADLTEQKRYESRLREKAFLLDYATDAILVRSMSNEIVYWNKAAELRYGWQAADAVGQPIREFLFPEAARPAFDRAMEELLERGDFSGRLTYRRRDGSLAVGHAHWILVRDEEGTARSILAIVTDLSDKIRLEQRLAQSQRLESLGQLTGGIAHDFNNLLTVIIGNAAVLAEELGQRAGLDELAESAALIVTAGTRGADLIKRLLAFARRQELAPATVGIGQVLEDMHGLLRRTLPESILLDLSCPAEAWPVYVDRPQLEAALLNLALNARDAMPDGGRLVIRAANIDIDKPRQAREIGLAQGNYVELDVADNGSGMTPEIAERAFEPFFTTKGEGRGSGLGLSMVYGFARQSRGHVQIHSEPGHGTSVKLYLPRARGGADSPQAAAQAPERVGKGRILMVEDDEMVRAHVAYQLRGLGYEVSLASSGPEALALLQEDTAFDLLFTDVVMPGQMNGPELAARAVRLRPGLPVLFTSGYVGDAGVRPEDIGGDARLLQKPYNKVELARAIAALVRVPG